MSRPRLPEWLRSQLRARVPPTLLWRGGIQAELQFWETFFRAKGGDWPADYQQRMDPEAPLGEPLIDNQLGQASSEPVKILDVGAGLTTSLGKTSAGRRIEIVGIDPLASDYRLMLGRLGVVVPAPSIAGRAEQLSALFAPESFDVVYARNSLDHTADPHQALAAMPRLLRTSGFVALRHFRREGEHARYETFHQWNFDLDQSMPKIWNRRSSFLLDDIAGLTVTHAAWEPRWITVLLRKQTDRGTTRVDGPAAGE